MLRPNEFFKTFHVKRGSKLTLLKSVLSPTFSCRNTLADAIKKLLHATNVKGHFNFPYIKEYLACNICKMHDLS